MVARTQYKKNRTFRATTLAHATASPLSNAAFADGHAKDIVDTAVAACCFGTLPAAAEAAGLVDTLKSEGPFTVFAPSDAAFAAFSEGTIEALLLPENINQLVAVLTYHMIAGKMMSTDLIDDMEADAIQGTAVMIDLDNGVMAVDASVVTWISKHPTA